MNPLNSIVGAMHVCMRKLVGLLGCSVFAALLLSALPAQGAITWVGSGPAGSSTGSNSRSLTIPTIVNGDLLIAHVAIRGNRNITPPAGWTLIDQRYVSGYRITQAVYYEVGSAAESGTSVTWSFDGWDDNAGIIRAYRGVNSVTPIGNVSGSTGRASSLTASSISTTISGEWLLGFFASADGRGSPFAPPVGMTERYDFDDGANNSGLSITGQDEERTIVGPTGDRTAIASRWDYYVGQLVALKPGTSVVSIARADPSPTAASSVSWTVTFGGSVSGLSSANFALVNSGLSGSPAITSVSGSGTTWTVTASTGTGSGTLGLNMTNASGVTPVVGGLPFTGEVYDIQQLAVSSMALASFDPTTANTSVDWTVTFNATASGVDASDFVLVEAGGATGSSITSVSGSGTTWTVTADTGTADTGTLGLNLVDDDSIVNGSGQPLGGVGAGNGDYTGPVYTLTPPAPTLNKTASAAAAVVGDVVTFTVTATNPYTAPLSNVVVSDILPTGMSYSTHVVTLGSVVVAGQDITWTIPTLPASGSAQMTIAVSLTASGLLTNTATSPGATSASVTILALASAVTHFRMDEPVGSWTGAAGEVIDSGGTALHGRRLTSSSPTTTNVVDPSPSIASQHPSVVGGFCNAAYFDGNAIVEVADSPNFDYTTQLSASAWIYPTAYPSSGLYSILSNDVNYEFHLDSSGHLFWWWNASTLTSAAIIPLNQWTHVAITFDSSPGVRRQRIYINGVLDSNTNNWQGTLQPNNCNFYIGGDVATGAACSIISARNFHGMIDEVKLYSFELSPDEVVADMNLGRSCSGTFDHVQIEHDGVGSICAPERVTIKACLDAACTTLYPGNVTVNLSPSGWIGGSTFSFSGGIATRQLSYGTPGNVTLGTNSVSPTPANATRCFNGATETCTLNFATSSCAFDAVETGAAPQSSIYTKLSGVPFDIDVLALLNSTTVNTGYTGTVSVDLVDATSSACPSGTGLNTPTNVTFGSGDAGRKTVTFNYSNAVRNVKVRAQVGASAPACSSDNFAIRPQAFVVSSTDATNTATGGTPVIKAGTPFNLTATSVAGYDGTPTVDNTKVTGTPVAGTVGGSFPAADSGTGIAAGNSFTYSEVGNFGLDQDAVYDSTFTAVDQPGDCVTGFSNTLSGGRYGCSIGSNAVAQNTGVSGFGRFIPYRFNVAANTPMFAPVCTPFTYLDQPFYYATDPALTVTALNAGGAVTNNYGGAYWKLAPAIGGRGYTNNATTAGGLSIDTPGSISVTNTADSDGIGDVTLQGEALLYGKSGTPETPFAADADLNFSAGFLTDPDGACYDPDNNGTCDAFTVSSIGGTELRWGRAVLGNAYGSELVPLNVPLSIEYWGVIDPGPPAVDEFVVNTADSCTTLAAGDFGFANYSGNLAAGDTLITGVALASGSGGVTLSAPGGGNDGEVDVLGQGSIPAYLLYDWDGDGVHDNPPSARATFGIYSGPPRRIYLREIY